MEKRILDVECFYGFTELFLRREFAQGRNYRAVAGAESSGHFRSQQHHSFGSQREASGALERVGQLQHAAFAEMPAEDLHAHRQAGFRLAAGD